MPSRPPAPSRRALYRHAKRTLYKALARRWTGSRASLDKHIRAFLRGKRRSYLLRLVRQHAFALAVATALLTGTHAHATDPIELSDIAMDANAGGFVMNGIDVNDRSGFSVSAAGDVNGDGVADLIVGAPGPYPAGNEGESYVVFGKADGTSVELSAISAGTGGFVIKGVGVSITNDDSGRSVSAAGDVNGDGLDDLIIGADGVTFGVQYFTGESYVVFGKASTTTVELSDVKDGTGGFAIKGVNRFDRSGRSVSGAGDVNGDGLADLIVGAKFADAGGVSSAGQSYVVFGKANGTAVELSDVISGTGGFVINGFGSNLRSGVSVSAAGDVNGDGLADLIVGAAWNSVESHRGKSYVVFGKADGTAVELSDVVSGTGGFLINGIDTGDFSGNSVSGAGDVNGDGLADLIVGAYAADPGLIEEGESYVVFGKADTTAVNLSAVAAGTGGFIINGIDFYDNSGWSVSGAGDVNGDGLADLIIGAKFADPGGYGYAGESYVVFGKADTTAVNLSAIVAGIGGFVMNGIDPSDVSGFSVSGAGDVNGDGLPDLIVGAYGGDPGSNSAAGESYVVFSPETAPASATYKAKSRAGDGAGGEIVVPTVLEDARFTIDYSDEDTADDGSGGASLETVTLHRDGSGIINLPSLTPSGVYWELSTDRTGWASAEVTLKYLPAEVAGLFGPESSFTVYTAPAASGPWTAAATTIDTVRNTATFTTTSDTVFALGTSSAYEKWADFGYVGTESGTAIEPFDTIAEAVEAVGAGGLIHLIDDSGDKTSSETPTLNKAVTIDAVGGPFLIGVPLARDAASGFISRRETSRE